MHHTAGTTSLRRHFDLSLSVIHGLSVVHGAAPGDYQRVLYDLLRGWAQQMDPFACPVCHLALTTLASKEKYIIYHHHQ
jgi:hypothetical protein